MIMKLFYAFCISTSIITSCGCNDSIDNASIVSHLNFKQELKRVKDHWNDLKIVEKTLLANSVASVEDFEMFLDVIKNNRDKDVLDPLILLLAFLAYTQPVDVESRTTMCPKDIVSCLINEFKCIACKKDVLAANVLWMYFLAGDVVRSLSLNKIDPILAKIKIAKEHGIDFIRIKDKHREEAATISIVGGLYSLMRLSLGLEIVMSKTPPPISAKDRSEDIITGIISGMMYCSGAFGDDGLTRLARNAFYHGLEGKSFSFVLNEALANKKSFTSINIEEAVNILSKPGVYAGLINRATASWAKNCARCKNIDCNIVYLNFFGEPLKILGCSCKISDYDKARAQMAIDVTNRIDIRLEGIGNDLLGFLLADIVIGAVEVADIGGMLSKELIQVKRSKLDTLYACKDKKFMEAIKCSATAAGIPKMLFNYFSSKALGENILSIKNIDIEGAIEYYKNNWCMFDFGNVSFNALFRGMLSKDFSKDIENYNDFIRGVTSSDSRGMSGRFMKMGSRSKIAFKIKAYVLCAFLAIVSKYASFVYGLNESNLYFRQSLELFKIKNERPNEYKRLRSEKIYKYISQAEPYSPLEAFIILSASGLYAKSS
ncbi:MAG: hypothetical protein KAH32_04940 [Chlamydiia bacterium]|nr:hypothetical protein [Chlamydiia bacterium]